MNPFPVGTLTPRLLCKKSKNINKKWVRLKKQKIRGKSTLVNNCHGVSVRYNDIPNVISRVNTIARFPRTIIDPALTFLFSFREMVLRRRFLGTYILHTWLKSMKQARGLKKRTNVCISLTISSTSR